MSGGGGELISRFYQLLLYWALALFAAIVGKPIKCPPLLLYLFFGAIVGNLHVVDHTDPALTFFSEWSITIVFFALGFEENMAHFMHSLTLSWGIALLGAVFPFISGYIGSTIFFSSEGWWVHITIATAVTATAVSLTMMLLQDQGLLKTKSAMGIMSSAVLDDVGCLVLVSILLPVVVAASPAAALNEIIVPYDNVTGSIIINTTGFASILGNDTALTHAEHVFGADLALLTNMSTVNMVVSADFGPLGAAFTFSNGAPTTCRAFDDAEFARDIALDKNGSWLTLTKEAYGPITNYTVSASAHKIIDITHFEAAQPKTGITGADIAWIIGKVCIFMIIIWILHVAILPNNITEGFFSYIPLLRSYGMKDLLSFSDGDQVPLTVVTFGLALGVCGVSFGFHPAVGAYFAGLILDDSYFILPTNQPEAVVLQQQEGSTKQQPAEPLKNEEEMATADKKSANNTNNNNNKTPKTTNKDGQNKKTTKTGSVLESNSTTKYKCTKTNLEKRGKTVNDEEKNRDKLLDNFLNDPAKLQPAVIANEQEEAQVVVEPDDGEFDRVMNEKKKLQGDVETNKTNDSYYPATPGEEEEEELVIEAEAVPRSTLERARDAIATAAFQFLGPVFFLHLGSSFEVKPELLATAIPNALGITVILYIFQFVSATLSARWVPGGYTWAESVLIGFGMLGRAELFFVVLNAAKAEKVLNPAIFFTMALVALFMNISLAFSVPLFKDTYLKYETWEPASTKEKEDDQDKIGSKRPSKAPTAASSRGSRLSRKSIVVRRGVGLRGVMLTMDQEPDPRNNNNIVVETANVSAFPTSSLDMQNQERIALVVQNDGDGNRSVIGIRRSSRPPSVIGGVSAVRPVRHLTNRQENDDSNAIAEPMGKERSGSRVLYNNNDDDDGVEEGNRSGRNRSTGRAGGGGRSRPPSVVGLKILRKRALGGQNDDDNNNNDNSRQPSAARNRNVNDSNAAPTAASNNNNNNEPTN